MKRPDDSRLAVLAGVAAAAGFAIAVGVVAILAESEGRAALGDLLPPLIVVCFALGVVVGAAALRFARTHFGGARRLVEEIDLIASVDPAHKTQVSGPPEIQEIATSVNRLAGRFWQSISERDVAIARGREEAEQDRERLAALMADLSHGVVVCNADGQILLYNSAAKRLFASEDDPKALAVGLGRSIFAVLDRNALINAKHRLELDGSRTSGSPVRFVAAGPGGQLMRASMGPVRGDSPELTGFVVVLDDATSERWARDLRDQLLRGTIETSRGRLAAITGAVETLREYEDLDLRDVDRFRSIIAEESGRLAEYLDDVQAKHAEAFGRGWELADMSGPDLLWAVQHRIEDTTDLSVAVSADEGSWVRIDAGGLIHVLVETAHILAQGGAAERMELSLTERDRFVGLDMAWPGELPVDDAIRASVAEGGDLATMARRHGGEAWVKPGDVHTLTVLLPAGSAVPAIAMPVPAEDRPTSYDFRLLSRNAPDAELAARRLADLTYTVFDLETTGLEPSRGDAIVSIGAVRILNGTLLSHESFDRLVDPERSISESSVAIHGITPDMVEGQPTIRQVLPQFSRFVDTTVLVGHNVAFDMKFLELLRPATGIEFTSPVLDTLLLAELAFGESAGHSLEWLSSTLSVDITGRHTALGDALVTAEVFLKLVPLLETKGLMTLGEVTEAAAKTKYAKIEY